MADVLSLTLSIRQGMGSRSGEYWAEWQDVTPGSLAQVSAGKWCATEAKACDWLVSEVADRMRAVADPPMDEACPDCKAEAGHPCHPACSSYWT